MILSINTKDQKQVTVSLKEDEKLVDSLSEEREYGSQVLLPLIVKLMQHIPTPGVKSGSTARPHTGSVTWEILEGIEVETGPGSFTGLRVGVSVANALGFALGIPVNSKKMETELQY